MSSASNALNGRTGVSSETRQRVEAAARQLNYSHIPRARHQTRRPTHLIVFGLSRDLDNLDADPVFEALITGIDEVISSSGYVLGVQIAHDGGDGLDRSVRLATSGRVDGLILAGIDGADDRLEKLVELGIPVVAINPPPGLVSISSVSQDVEMAIEQMVQTFVALGHKQMAHVRGRSRGLFDPGYLARCWSSAVLDAGLEPSFEVSGDGTIDSGRVAAEILMTSPRTPTAVFCTHDAIAGGFASRVSELELQIPRDVSIAGFGGLTLGKLLSPALSTVKTSPRELGRESASALLSHIAGGAATVTELAPARLVMRGSVGREGACNLPNFRVPAS